MSLMEAVACVAGEPHSYRPKCASPVIGDFLDTLEFCSNAEERQKLKRFIPKLIGTAASDAVELRRSWMALDWTVRVLAPAWLRLADFDAQADALEALAEIDGILTFKAARDTIREACFTPRTPGAPPGTQRPIGTNGTRPLGELPRRLGSGKDRSR